MRVKWSTPALTDLTDIIDYIRTFDEQAADNFADRFAVSAAGLGDFPHKGRPIGRGIRQLSSVYPYHLRYRIRRDHVEIIAVRHGARR